MRQRSEAPYMAFCRLGAPQAHYFIGLVKCRLPEARDLGIRPQFCGPRAALDHYSVRTAQNLHFGWAISN